MQEITLNRAYELIPGRVNISKGDYLYLDDRYEVTRLNYNMFMKCNLNVSFNGPLQLSNGLSLYKLQDDYWICIIGLVLSDVLTNPDYSSKWYKGIYLLSDISEVEYMCDKLNKYEKIFKDKSITGRILNYLLNKAFVSYK